MNKIKLLAAAAIVTTLVGTAFAENPMVGGAAMYPNNAPAVAATVPVTVVYCNAKTVHAAIQTSVPGTSKRCLVNRIVPQRPVE